MPNLNLILPYSLPEKERQASFTQDMEVASILILSEERRRRSKDLEDVQKVAFICKLHYPLWAIPWKKRCLLVDGCRISSVNLAYMALPDVDRFLEDIERGKQTRSIYHQALEKHTYTFNDFTGTEHVSVDNVVADENLSFAISEYIKATLVTKTHVKEQIVLIPYGLDGEAAREKAEKVFNLYRRIQSDIKGLQFASRTLNNETKFHIQMIQREIELMDETNENALAQITPIVEKNVERLSQKWNAKIKKARKIVEKELRTKIREKEKRERELERLELNKEKYKKRKSIHKRRNDQVGIANLERKLRICQTKIEKTQDRIRILSKFIEKSRKQNEIDIKRLSNSYRTLINQESKKIFDLKESFQIAYKAKQAEAEKMQAITQHIIELTEQLAKQKRLHSSELKNLTIPLQFELVTLVSVPFYLSGYKREEKFQFHVFPPVRIMSSKGIIKRIQKAIRGFSITSRIKLLMQFRSKELNKIIGSVFDEKTQPDNVFESLRELGESHNLLNSLNFEKTLIKGMTQLKAEGWISQEEENAVVTNYL